MHPLRENRAARARRVGASRSRAATSGRIPGVRIPADPFVGVIGVAPSAERLAFWNAREAAVGALPPLTVSATPTRLPTEFADRCWQPVRQASVAQAKRQTSRAERRVIIYFFCKASNSLRSESLIMFFTSTT